MLRLATGNKARHDKVQLIAASGQCRHVQGQHHSGRESSSAPSKLSQLGTQLLAKQDIHPPQFPTWRSPGARVSRPLYVACAGELLLPILLMSGGPLLSRVVLPEGVI